MQANDRRIFNSRARHSICGFGQDRYRPPPGRQVRHGSTSATEPHDASCKVMLIGDSGVGKTSFLHQFKDAKFPGSTFITTVGIDYRSKILPVDGYRIRFQVWDTAGTERYRSISSAYYRDADAILLFYDITNRQSFNSVRSWLSDVREFSSENVYVILLGNKSDAESDRKVALKEGQQLAKENGLACFMETSAKTGYQVELCHKIIGRRQLSKRQLTTSGIDSVGCDASLQPVSLANQKISGCGNGDSGGGDERGRQRCNYC